MGEWKVGTGTEEGREGGWKEGRKGVKKEY